MRCHCGYGNLEYIGSTSRHYMRLYHTEHLKDFSTQANMVLPVLPSQDLHHTTYSSDTCAQCELVCPDDLEDQASEEHLRASSRGSRKSVSILEAEAWLKNSTDIAVTCHLPIRCKSRGGAEKGGITLTSLLRKIIDNVISNKTSLSSISDVRDELTRHAINKLIDSLNCLSYKNSAVNDPTLVNWLLSVGYLATLEQLLIIYIEEAVVTTSSRFPSMLSDSCVMASRKLKTTSENYSMVFSYTLEDIAVQDESTIR